MTQLVPKLPLQGVRIVCNDGLCRPVYVGARTSGEIVDVTGRPIVGAAMVLPEHVGVDMEDWAQAAVDSSRPHREGRALATATRIAGF